MKTTAATPALRSYVRGSGVLFAGRFVAVALNCVIQILVVRYLVKEDYGAFAYGLAAVALLTTTILSGLGKALPRMVALHHEQENHAAAFGHIALAVMTVLTLGGAMVFLAQVFDSQLGAVLAVPPGALAVLLILIAVAPLDAVDHLFQHLAAIFCGARTIVFRRHLAGPLLRLSAIGFVIASAGSVVDLAYGYLAASAIGVCIYGTMLVREWRKRDLLQYLQPSRLELGARELFGFSIPLVASDVTVAVRGSFAVLALGHLGTLRDVADYRAVLPVAGLNMVAAETFAFLFVPAASRLFARGEQGAMHNLYWHSSLWIAMLTLPVMVITVALASPLVVEIFGPEYAGAAPVLAVLSCGYYFNAAMGFNSSMLRVAGHLRVIVINEALATAFCLVLITALVPMYGALGAAIGTTATFMVQNVLNYLRLREANGGLRVSQPVASLYKRIGTAAVVLIVGLRLVGAPLVFGVAAAALLSLVVMRLARNVLDVGATFPELMRVPGMRWLVR